MGLGRCLNMLSIHTRPDSALQWSDEYCTVITSNGESLEEGTSPSSEVKPPDSLGAAKYGALSSVMRLRDAEAAEVRMC